MNNEHPYMPLYFGDVLKQTMYWSGEERALLVMLMAAQWWNGPLPRDLAKLADAIKYDPDTFNALWNSNVSTLFVETPDGFVYEPLEVRRRYSARVSGARRAAGKASGKARRARSDQSNSGSGAANILFEQTDEQNARTNGRTRDGPLVRTLQTNPNQSKSDQEEEPQISEPASVDGSTTVELLPLLPVTRENGADPPPLAAATTERANGKSAHRRRRMPKDYPVEHWREWARENTPRVDFDAEIAVLRDHEFRDPHSDWDAVIRNWLRRADRQRSRAPVGEQRLTRFEQHKRRLYDDA